MVGTSNWYRFLKWPLIQTHILFFFKDWGWTNQLLGCSRPETLSNHPLCLFLIGGLAGPVSFGKSQVGRHCPLDFGFSLWRTLGEVASVNLTYLRYRRPIQIHLFRWNYLEWRFSDSIHCQSPFLITISPVWTVITHYSPRCTIMNHY